MSIETWVMFFVAYLLVTLSPGPNVLLVIKNSIQHGWVSTLLTILANLCCQLIIVCLVAIGVAELLVQLPSYFLFMKCLGGAYLIYLGIKSIKQTGDTRLGFDTNKSAHRNKRSIFKEALFVSASNPKTLIFLSAFLPQFLDTRYSHSQQFVMMFLTICFIVTAVHLSYAQLVKQIGRKLSVSRFQNKLSKIIGGLFVSMGGGVLFAARQH